jgi:hypothetical protein
MSMVLGKAKVMNYKTLTTHERNALQEAIRNKRKRARKLKWTCVRDRCSLFHA